MGHIIIVVSIVIYAYAIIIVCIINDLHVHNDISGQTIQSICVVNLNKISCYMYMYIYFDLLCVSD